LNTITFPSFRNFLCICDGYNIASRERAICDTLYLNPKAYFDNVEGVNMQKLKEISKIYKKPAMILALEDWFPGHFKKNKAIKTSKNIPDKTK
jgi:hypothetical protein